MLNSSYCIGLFFISKLCFENLDTLGKVQDLLNFVGCEKRLKLTMQAQILAVCGMAVLVF